MNSRRHDSKRSPRRRARPEIKPAMIASQTSRRSVNRLCKIRTHFDAGHSQEKLQLLRELNGVRVRLATELMRLHGALCFIRAFPDTVAHFKAAHTLLMHFEERVLALSAAERLQLDDSGIIGTPIYYAFSFEVATWMARRLGGSVSFHWEDIEEVSRLDELLELMLLPAEADYFDSGYVSGQEWIELASKNSGATDFHWFITQLMQHRPNPALAQTYNAADLSLVWDLREAAFSKSCNIVRVGKVKARKHGMRKPSGAAHKEIKRPVDSLKKLPRRAATKLIDVAMASLAVRHRETNHFNCANPQEVYLADVGEGISIAVFGLQHDDRFALECTMGYLILSNGVPVGYGGGSAVFCQINIGLNIFDEYRGSEAAFLWVQVMRVYHQLTGCTRFIANAYQFGSDNAEALQSGAFWFYYRLGYRPVVPSVRKQAQSEFSRMRDDRSYRSSLRKLRSLSSCDMHLVFPGARASELFEERWIETSSMLATQEIAAAGGRTRSESAKNVAARVARDLGMRSVGNFSAAEMFGFHRIAPLVAAAKPAGWPAAAKRSMRAILRAKGGEGEAEFARLLAKNHHFLAELRKRCRRAER